MSAINLNFQLHKPNQISKFQIGHVGGGHQYFPDTSENLISLGEFIEDKVFPTLNLLLKLLRSHPQFKFSLTISGELLSDLDQTYPHLISTIQSMLETGRVEIVSEPSFNSLSYLFSIEEFKFQVQSHTSKLSSLFGVTPETFKNTAFTFDQKVGQVLADFDFQAVLYRDSRDQKLDPGKLYATANMKVLIDSPISSLLKERELDLKRLAKAIDQEGKKAEIINLFIDINNIGKKTLSVLASIPSTLLHNSQHYFLTAGEAAATHKSEQKVSFPNSISWGEIARELPEYASNPLQQQALATLYELEKPIKQSANLELIETWRKLQSAEYFLYMNTSLSNHISPYDTPYQAFIYYMNIIEDLKLQLEPQSHEGFTILAEQELATI